MKTDRKIKAVKTSARSARQPGETVELLTSRLENIRL